MHSMTAEKPNYNEVKNQYLPQPYANAGELYEDSSCVTTVKEKATDLSQKVQEQSAKVVDKAKSLKSQATPPLDDGTVSSEGEEPIEEILDRTVTEVEDEEKAFEDSVFVNPEKQLPPKE